MPTENKQNFGASELLDDIQFVNQSAEAEISRVGNKIRRHLNKVDLPKDVANSLIDEVSSQLGQLTAKVKITEKAIQNLQSGHRKKPWVGDNIIASTQATNGDICYPAQKLAGTENLLPIETSPNGISYCWSGADPEIEFSFNIDRVKRLELQLILFALIKPEYSKQLKILVDGEHCKHWFFAEGPLFVATCQIPASSETGPTNLKILIPDTHCPIDLGEGLDGRTLGLAISEIRFTRPTGALTRLLKRLRLQ